MDITKVTRTAAEVVGALAAAVIAVLAVADQFRTPPDKPPDTQSRLEAVPLDCKLLADSERVTQKVCSTARVRMPSAGPLQRGGRSANQSDRTCVEAPSGFEIVGMPNLTEKVWVAGAIPTT